MAEILPARAQRVTVLGFTRNMAATSEGVRSCSGSGAGFWGMKSSQSIRILAGGLGRISPVMGRVAASVPIRAGRPVPGSVGDTYPTAPF